MKKLILLILTVMLGITFAGLGCGGIAGAAPVDIIDPDITPIKLSPAAPSNLTATAISITKIELNWTDNSSTETGFIIEVKATGGLFFSTLETVGSNVTTYTHANPIPGLPYHYRVKAFNASGDSDYSNVAIAATTLPGLPAAPSNLAAEAASSSAVNLSWTDNSSDETGFVIEAKTGSSGYSVIELVGPNASTFAHTGLSPNTTYYYRVKARNDSGDSGYTNETGVTTPAASPAPPAAPSNLVATSETSTKIILSWTDNSTNETGFYLERKPEGGVYELCAGIGANGTNYTDQLGLVPNATYYYRIRASNASGYSDYSNEVSVTTPAPAPPAAPSNLVATAASSTAVNLSWTDNSSDEVGFTIESKTGSSGYSVIGVIGPNFSTFAHTGLSPSTTYYYKVKACNVFGVYSSSNEASAATPAADPIPTAPPAAPSNLTAAAASSSAVNLSWTDNSGDETGFIIEAKTGSSGYSVIGVIGPNFSTFAHTGLSPNTTYYYRVKARNASGDSGYTNEASAATPAASPAPPAPAQKDFEIILQIGNPYMTVNGASREIDPGRGTVPVILNNRTLVPVRAIVEAMGGTVEWEETEKKVTVRLKGTVIELWIGSNTTKVNGEEKITDVAPQLIVHRTMLPLRFVSENLGCNVGWDEATKKVTIKSVL